MRPRTLRLFVRATAGSAKPLSIPLSGVMSATVIAAAPAKNTVSALTRFWVGLLRIGSGGLSEGSVAKNILATVSCAGSDHSDSIYCVVRKILQHYPCK